MESVNSSVAESVRSEKTMRILAIIGDTGLNAAVSSGILNDVPVIGMLVSCWKAGNEIKHELYVRKIARFLGGLASTTSEEHTKFTEKLERDGTTEKFGETILLLLEKIDDIDKPGIIGRIMAAHIKGHIDDYNEAMRLAYIINRCYAQDLEYIKSFRNGTQGKMTAVADALFSAGLLSNVGIDGGHMSDPNSGGTIYELNEYGEMLVKFGWV